ncbi:MAG: hypothetical protein AAGH15_28840, partial [Myxococcota bacterium]
PDGRPTPGAVRVRPLAPPLEAQRERARPSWELRPQRSRIANLFVERSPFGLAFFGRLRLAQEQPHDRMFQHDEHWFMAIDFEPALFVDDLGRLVHGIRRRPEGLAVLTRDRLARVLHADGSQGAPIEPPDPTDGSKPDFEDLPEPFAGVLEGYLREGIRDTRFVRRDLRGHKVDDVGLRRRAEGAALSFDGSRALVAHAARGEVRTWEIACTGAVDD